MLFHKLCVTLLPVLLSLTAPQVGALDTITRRGKYLFKPDGTRFYIRGIAYQESAETVSDADTGGFPEPETYTDPLSLPQACRRDVANLRTLGVNAVRIYSVDSNKDHSACVRAFEEAGIYLMIDLSLPAGGSINRAQPRWDVPLLQQYIATIDEFSQYSNVLSFGVANEVVSNDETTAALPFVRAAVRDVKAYLRSKNRSNILVSYSSTDGPGGNNGRRTLTAQYLSCGALEEALDLIGLNTYSWCGNSSFTAAGYDQLVSDYASLPVAAYFSEFGCVQNVGTGNRPWTEVPALLSPPMTDSFSGGSAFGYFPKSPLAQGLDYGLVSLEGDNVTPRGDFNNLRDQYAQATNAPAAAPSRAPQTSDTCPRRGGEFRASARYPPTPNPALCACLARDGWACAPTEAVQASAQRVGELTGTACSLLTSNNVTNGCDQVIEADGSAGRYGNYSACSAVDRLTWAMSAYLDVDRLAVGACDFAGNATEKQNPSTVQQGKIAEAQCQTNNGSPLAIAIPTGTAVPAANAGGSGSGSGSGSPRPSNAPSSATMMQSAIPGALAFLVALAAGAIILA